jgi:hypothetical protein
MTSPGSPLERPPAIGRAELRWAATWPSAVFGALGPLAGIAVGIVAWRIEPSLPTAVVAGIAGASIVGRALPAAFGGRRRPARVAFHAVFPAVVVASFAMLVAWWDATWVAAVVAVVASIGITGVVKAAWFPELSLEEDGERQRHAERWRPGEHDLDPRRWIHRPAA